MPERPKRRKNNKNKRKNKTNQHTGNKNISDVKDSNNIETCSVQSDDLTEDKPSISGVDEKVVCDISSLQSDPNKIDNNIHINYEDQKISVLNDINDSESTRKNAPESICRVVQVLNQDFNNNSNRIDIIDIPVSISNADVRDIEKLELQSYVVESPDQLLKTKRKIGDTVKSKSLDNDDAPKIEEVTDSTALSDNETSAIIDGNVVLVSEVESDVEWEKTDELNDEHKSQSKEMATGTLSITTIPLNIAQCEHNKSLTPEEEMSLRNYLKTLNLASNPENIDSLEIKTEIEQIINREIRQRLRKKGLAEDIFTQRLGPPRVLDVIDEEGSSESSMTSRRQSYLSDKRSDNEDLEDDVFEDLTKINEKYNTKSINALHKRSFGRHIPQQCLLVGAKLKEPEVTEARGDWSVQTVEKMTGAEVVYLTDSSSSTSSIHDIGDETDDGVETDVSVRMITPTIEVTDTENLLKNTFISYNDPREKSIQVTFANKSNKNEHKVPLEEVQPKTIDSDFQNSHEIIVLSTDNIKTDLYVKELDKSESSQENDKPCKNRNDNINSSSKKYDTYDLEIKVLKCELNDAINNLIKEVSSDTETANESPKDAFMRQDSSSSISSSQCTAKYNPNYSSLNDVSNTVHDEPYEINKPVELTAKTYETSHVKDVIECVTETSTNSRNENNRTTPQTLRDLCVRKIANFPYGDKILEELASVSKRLQNINIHGINSSTNLMSNICVKEDKQTRNMPYYPLPDLSSIDKISLTLNKNDPPIPPPPPVHPRKSSLKITHDEDHWTGIPTQNEPVYVCLSPSQKMLMEKTNTVLTKEDASQLVEMHNKFVDRRGYNECYNSKDIQKDVDGVDIAPVVPFKSQTGSRLLALIRDPKVAGQFKSTQNDNYNADLCDRYVIDKSIGSKSQNRINNEKSYTSRDISTTFKPIPPPRPKKTSFSYNESDESSDFTENSFRSMKNEKKYFHFSTGSLSKDLENDISSIQNMHRYYTNMRDHISNHAPRRPSLPKDLCEQQMEYIRQKEKEVEAELQRLEEKRSVSSYPKRGPRAPLIPELEVKNEKSINEVSHKKGSGLSLGYPDNIMRNERGKMSSLFSSSQEEILRDKMYSEYVCQMAERHERKQHKVIKITNTPNTSSNKISKSMSALDILDSKVNNRIEKEFISKARERWVKLGIKDPETEDEKESSTNVYKEPKVLEHKIKVIEAGKERDVRKLPNHLQEFVRFTVKDKEPGSSSTGESNNGPASPHVVILCAVIILVLAVGKYFLRLFRNK